MPLRLACLKNNKKEFIKESKARNNTFNRRGRKNNVGLSRKDKATNRTNLPKLKALIPDSKNSVENSSIKRHARRQPKKYANVQSSALENKSGNESSSFKKHTRRQPKKFANVRSSGYGAASVAPTSNASATTKTKLSQLPSLVENKTHHSHGYSMPKRNNARRIR